MLNGLKMSFFDVHHTSILLHFPSHNSLWAARVPYSGTQYVCRVCARFSGVHFASAFTKPQLANLANGVPRVLMPLHRQKAVAKAAEPVTELFGFDGNILKLASPASYATDAASSGKRKEIDSLGQIVGVVESLRYVGTVPLRVVSILSSPLFSHFLLSFARFCSSCFFLFCNWFCLKTFSRNSQ